ncbi:hypothetical protein [Phenylobacterium sp. 58.2.17]|uniref:hypothetical protein n=1 Tax=Phenylobacterium sp. 58.2.17 TaxID=2969306 RepID=UPI0022644EF5|nr:hypothetical protein [Phenylobacterium sp. 58.2.17]MCX7586486.1 hypothetical protein [Phenylobacterium sp. 58.2.17]
MQVRVDKARHQHLVLKRHVDAMRVLLQPGLEIFQRSNAQDFAPADRHSRRRRLAGIHGDDLLGDEDGDRVRLLKRGRLRRHGESEQCPEGQAPREL